MDDKSLIFEAQESEDSDSTSSKEEERRLLLAKQTVVEDDKTIEIRITDSQLEELVLRTQTVTTLLKPECEQLETDRKDILYSFHANLSYSVLFSYAQDGKVKTTFDVPSAETDIVYFLKISSYDEVADTRPFSKIIIFGKIDMNFQLNLLLILKLVFTCALYNMKSSPYRVKKYVTKNLENFLCHLTLIYYRNNGLNEMYVPALTFLSEKLILQHMRVNDVVSLFEGVVVHWCNLISDVICDTEIHFDCVKNFNVLVFLKFWQYRMDNLRLTLSCVQDERADIVYRILQDHNSIHLKLLNQLKNSLQEEITETTSVLHFLHVANELYNEINKISGNANIPSLFSKIFSVLRTIENESQYFKIGNISLLLSSVSKQIINVCKEKISIEKILQGDTEESMVYIFESVHVCYLYRKTLSQSMLDNCWSCEMAEFEEILNCISAFVLRCYNLLDLCSLINIFHSSSGEGNANIQMPLQQHIDVKEILAGISDNFRSNLMKLASIQDRILFTQCTDWYKANHEFLLQLKKIEDNIVDFVQKSSRFITTIEDEINLLRITCQYSKLKYLSSFFKEENRKLIEKFSNEMDEIAEEVFFQNITPSIADFNFQHFVVRTFTRKRRLQFCFKLLTGCHWLVEYSSLNETRLKYEDSLAGIDRLLLKNYKCWLEQLQVPIANQLKRPLIGMCFYKDGLLEVNIDRKLLKLNNETHTWIQIGFVPPPSIDKWLSSMSQILILYGNVEDLVMNYNRIISGTVCASRTIEDYPKLTPEEHVLFSEVINICREAINPTMYTLHWDYEQCNHIILDYLKQVKLLENLIRCYKYQNTQIIYYCKLISKTNCLIISKNEFELIKEEINISKLNSCKSLINYYNLILSCIQTLFDNFGHHIKKMKDIWNLYIGKIDTLLESALKCCIKNSLKDFLDNISPDFDTEDDTSIKINLFIKVENGNINFHPKLSEIVSFFSHLNMSLIGIVKLIPRLFNKFKLIKTNKKASFAEKLSDDEDIKKLKENIDTIILDNLQAVKRRIKQWNWYRCMWKISPENYATCYCDNGPTDEDYILDFTMYFRLIRIMQNTDCTEQIRLFTLNTEQLISEIVKQCQNRLFQLSEKLRTLVISLITNIRNYIYEKYSRLNEMRILEDQILYVDCIRNLIRELCEKEKEILKISDHVHVLNHFNFHSELHTHEEAIIKEWSNYKNTVERHRLRVKLMYRTDL